MKWATATSQNSANFSTGMPGACRERCFATRSNGLRPGGVLGLSTTHRETDLDPLLKAIEVTLESEGLRTKFAADWDTVYKVNKSLEKNLVRRYTRDQVREMIQLAGFQIIKDVPSTYEGAVMLIHARKPDDDSTSDSMRDSDVIR